MLRYPWKGSKMDQRERPKKPPSLVSLDANAAKAMLETKADPRDPNARAILKFIGGSKAVTDWKRFSTINAAVQ